MKKILFVLLLLTIIFVLTACGPTTTQVSQNTNLTQSTTITTGVATTHIPVTHIELIADMQEVCQAAVITLTVNVLPTNATNQNYTITIPTNIMLDFVASTNNLQVEVIGNPPGGAEILQILITVTSDDNTSIDNTVSIYVYSDISSPPQCQLN
jgi:ABC-type glycerol-3-phosphate transport system substrate-binding protein